MRLFFVDIFMERIKLMIPLALFASAIFSYLIFSRNKLFDGIENKIGRIFLKTVSYLVIIFFASLFLIFIGMMLLFGSLGLPVLAMLDIAGIVFLIRRIVLSRRNKRKGAQSENRINYMKV